MIETEFVDKAKTIQENVVRDTKLTDILDPEEKDNKEFSGRSAGTSDERKCHGRCTAGETKTRLYDRLLHDRRIQRWRD